MSFFDDFPKPDPPPDPPMPKHEPWMGPELGWIGGWVPWRVVLVKTSDLHLVLRDFEAFPTGLKFSGVVSLRPGLIDPRHHPFMMSMMRNANGPRFGVKYSDGRKTAMGFRPTDQGEQSTGAVLVPQGGGGSGGEWRQGFWLWPLPPPGLLTWAVEWEEHGVPETQVTVEADVLQDAANEAEQLWEVKPEDLRTGGFGTTSTMAMRTDPEKGQRGN